MNWQFTPYVFAYLATGVISTAVAWMCWRRRTIPTSIPLAFLMLAVAEWASVGALEMAAVGIPAKVFWSKVQYLGTVTSPVLVLIFALEYSRQTKWLTRRNLLLLFSLPLATLIIAATNEWHRLVWTSFTFSPSGENLLIYGHGAWFWVLVGYSYLSLTLSILILARSFVRFQRPYRRQALLLLIGALVPSAWNVIYVFDLSPIPGLDVTPIAFAFTGWILALSIFRLQLLDLVPVAHDTLIENMSDGVLVLDAQDRVLDINPAALELIGRDSSIVGQPVGQILNLIPPGDSDPETQSGIVLGKDMPRYLEMRLSPLRDHRGYLSGRLVVLRDITRHKQTEDALQEMNVSLERLVAARTSELQTTITKLENEIAERRRAEESLRQIEQDLAQRVADHSRKLSALYELILFAGQSRTVEEIQEQSLATIMTVVNCDTGCIHQYDERGGILRLVTQRGLSAEMQAQIEALPADWLLGDKIPRTVADLSTDASVPAAIRLPELGAYLGTPTYLQGKPTGALSAFWNHARSFSVEDIALFSALADQLGIIIENVRLRQRGEAAAVQQERRRLARDLHDSVTQSLHSLVLSADTAANRLRQERYERLETSLAQLSESARQALKEMRLLLFELRLATLDQVNLVEALQIRLDAVEKRAGIDAKLIVENVLNLPKVWEKELYCVAMEALNNSLKHARATQVLVQLRGDSNGVELDIADNGKGIDPQTSKPGGMGLHNMAERAERLGGKLTITSAPGAGTRINLRIEGDS